MNLSAVLAQAEKNFSVHFQQLQLTHTRSDGLHLIIHRTVGLTGYIGPL